MKTVTLLITINAILWMGLGIAFALYGPLMLAFFGIPETVGADVFAYWQVASFARLFGAALLGSGLVLWALRSLVSELTSKSLRGLIFSLLLANLIGTYVAVTQQSAVWQVPIGWILASIFGLLMLAYGYLLASKTS